MLRVAPHGNRALKAGLCPIDRIRYRSSDAVPTDCQKPRRHEISEFLTQRRKDAKRVFMSSQKAVIRVRWKIEN